MRVMASPFGMPRHRHGQFNDASVPFWRIGFWLPGSAGCEEARTQRALAVAPTP